MTSNDEIMARLAAQDRALEEGRLRMEATDAEVKTIKENLKINTATTERIEANTSTLATALADRRVLEASLEKTEVANKEKTREQIAAADRRAALVIAGLRNRADRPAAADVPKGDKPADAGEGAGGCTGAGLYRPDGEFLVGESARANVLRIALQSCYRSYDTAAEKLKAED